MLLCSLSSAPFCSVLYCSKSWGRAHPSRLPASRLPPPWLRWPSIGASARACCPSRGPRMRRRCGGGGGVGCGGRGAGSFRNSAFYAPCSWLPLGVGSFPNCKAPGLCQVENESAPSTASQALPLSAKHVRMGAVQVREIAGALGWRLGEGEVAELDALSSKIPSSTGAPFENW